MLGCIRLAYFYIITYISFMLAMQMTCNNTPLENTQGYMILLDTYMILIYLASVSGQMP